MSPEIPEYYRHLASSSEDKEDSEGQNQDQQPVRGMPIPESARKRKEAAPPPPPPLTNEYRADRFTISLPDGWTDKTVFTLTGPATDDIQHNITIAQSTDVVTENLEEFADQQIQSLESELKGCRLLLQKPTQLENGMPAYRAIFVWWPTEELRLYQEQLYVLHEGKAYTLTASFTKKTRKTLGPQIERAMRSFSPNVDR